MHKSFSQHILRPMSSIATRPESPGRVLRFQSQCRLLVIYRTLDERIRVLPTSEANVGLATRPSERAKSGKSSSEGSGKGPAGQAWVLGSGVDSRKMASGGNPCHRHLQPRGKTKILASFVRSNRKST